MPVTLTRKQWEGAIILSGLSARTTWSADLQALNDALGRYETRIKTAPRMPATDLRAAFRKWDEGGGNPGEHLLVDKTQEYAQLKRELAQPDPVPMKAPPPVPKKMLIAVWTCKHGAPWHQLTRDVRHGYLDNVLDLVRQHVAAIPTAQRTDGPIKAILAAPEYQYTSERNRRYPMTEGSKVVVEEALRVKSEANPGVLLIAGTSHYFKDEIRPSNAAKFKVNPLTGVRDVAKANTDRRERAKEHLDAAKLMAVDAGLAFLVDRGDVRHQDQDATKPIVHNVPALDKLGKVLTKGSSKPRFVRNVAYLFFDGRRMAKYDKQTDFSEALNNSPDVMMFIPGTEKQCPVIGGYRFGVEICYDHCNGVLKQRAPENLQFHVVVSDWTNTRPGHMAMAPGGYYLHASTNGTETAVYRRPVGGGEPEKLTPTDSLVAGENKLEFYVVYEPRPAAVKASDVPSLMSQPVSSSQPAST